MPRIPAPMKSPAAARRPRVEPLEPRWLMAAAPSASVVGDRLVVRGTAAADSIVVDEELDETGLVTVAYRVHVTPREAAPGGGTAFAPLSQTFPVGAVRRVVVSAGAGDDHVEFNPPVPAVVPPTSRGVSLPTRVDLGAGDDSFSGGNNDDLVAGGRGDDTLQSHGGRDVLAGGAGNDLITGGLDDDVIGGGAGDDELHGGAGNDTLLGNAGADLLGALDAFTGSNHYEDDPGDDVMIGGGGDDDLRGGTGADTVFGNAGRDTVGGGNGDADRLRGGAGADRFYEDEAETERLDFAQGLDEFRGPTVAFAAADDAFTLAEGGIYDVLANDTPYEHDASGRPLSITAVSIPAHGAATVAAVALPDGGQRPAIYYNAPGDFRGAVTFTYTLTDGRGRTDTATVTITAAGDTADNVTS